MAPVIEFKENNIELKFRSQANNLADQFRNAHASEIFYYVDSVEVMSRSFADQLHKEIETLKSDNILVFIKGANTQVQAVLQAVAQTQNATQRETGNYIVRNFTKDNIQDFFAMLNGKTAY